MKVTVKTLQQKLFTVEISDTETVRAVVLFRHLFVCTNCYTKPRQCWFKSLPKALTVILSLEPIGTS